MADTLLITGGSRGIGAATAVLAAQHGYNVCLSYVSDAASAEVVKQSCQDLGVKALAVRADVSDEAEVLNLFNRCDAALGVSRVVVNNAGIVGDLAPMVEFSAERMRRIVDVNIFGALLVAREAARRMSTEQGGRGGSIVNVGSKASTLGSPNEYIDYAATKGAVDSMTIGLAKELGPHGVRVNCVRPGLIETDIHAAGRLERLAPNVPQQRGGTAQEVAELIIWLGSSKADYVTGALVDIAGGR